MKRTSLLLPVVLIALGVRTPAEILRAKAAVPSPVATVSAARDFAARELAKLEHERFRWPEDRERFDTAARTAWMFLDKSYHPGTGLTAPIGAHPYATIWDIGSMIAAVYCAHELQLIDDGRYDTRMRAMLDTLQRVTLHDGRAFNKNYHSRTGEASAPFGWSTTDLGRLLIWLRIVGSEPQFAASAKAIVDRIDFTSILKNGYLWGESQDKAGRRETYPEGTIGYEQYSAQGYALWGQRAKKALRWQENALPVSVMDQPLVADYRRRDRLTPEPFLLWGLEVGWDPGTRALVRHLLLALEARYEKTGVVTITGEDAIDKPPHYFYYYCIYANGLDFSIDVQTRRAVVDGPRWISSKAVYAFDALMPSSYTAVAAQAVDAAHGPSGWAAGVYEHNGASTGNNSINTAAVILTAALYHARGTPILAHALSKREPVSGHP